MAENKIERINIFIEKNEELKKNNINDTSNFRF